MQKEAATKEYANTRYDQPYQAALYENSVLLEAQRWHTDEYEKVIGGLEPADLEVWTFPPQHLGSAEFIFCALNRSLLSDDTRRS